MNTLGGFGLGEAGSFLGLSSGLGLIQPIKPGMIMEDHKKVIYKPDGTMEYVGPFGTVKIVSKTLFDLWSGVEAKPAPGLDEGYAFMIDNKDYVAQLSDGTQHDSALCAPLDSDCICPCSMCATEKNEPAAAKAEPVKIEPLGPSPLELLIGKAKEGKPLESYEVAWKEKLFQSELKDATFSVPDCNCPKCVQPDKSSFEKLEWLVSKGLNMNPDHPDKFAMGTIFNAKVLKTFTASEIQIYLDALHKIDPAKHSHSGADWLAKQITVGKMILHAKESENQGKTPATAGKEAGKMAGIMHFIESSMKPDKKYKQIQKDTPHWEVTKIAAKDSKALKPFEQKASNFKVHGPGGPGYSAGAGLKQKINTFDPKLIERDERGIPYF